MKPKRQYWVEMHHNKELVGYIVSRVISGNTMHLTVSVKEGKDHGSLSAAEQWATTYECFDTAVVRNDCGVCTDSYVECSQEWCDKGTKNSSYQIQYHPKDGITFKVKVVG